MKGTPYSIRNNEFYGDFEIWVRENAEDNEAQMSRLKCNLRHCIAEELTERQRQLLNMRYYQNMRVSDIAKELCVDKSTVSRTITRAKSRIEKVLKYSI